MFENIVIMEECFTCFSHVGAMLRCFSSGSSFIHTPALWSWVPCQVINKVKPAFDLFITAVSEANTMMLGWSWSRQFFRMRRGEFRKGFYWVFKMVFDRSIFIIACGHKETYASVNQLERLRKVSARFSENDPKIDSPPLSVENS